MLLLQVTAKGEALTAELRERTISHMSEVLTRLRPEELDTVKQGLTLLANAAETHAGQEDVSGR